MVKVTTNLVNINWKKELKLFLRNNAGRNCLSPIFVKCGYVIDSRMEVVFCNIILKVFFSYYMSLKKKINFYKKLLNYLPHSHL